MPSTHAAQPDLNVAGMLCIGFDGPVATPAAETLIREGVRCVALFARNFSSRPQLAALCAHLHALAGHTPDDPLLVCVDHEGGRVQRFREGFTAIPSPREIGAGDPAKAERDAERWGQVAGAELRAVGVDVNFAPSVDVDTNPQNPVIGSRSFGRAPELVARCGVAFLQGLQSAGVAACAKHFPGHGDTIVDSHYNLPRLPHGPERMEQVELAPFRAAIAAGVASVMTAHVVFDAVDPGVPATLSRRLLDGVLRAPARGEMFRGMAFDGLVFSDDMEMKAIAEHFGDSDAVVRAANAGCDVLLSCADPRRQRAALESLRAALRDGRMLPQRVAQATARRLAVARRFAAG